ncbi:hemolysin family protein [Magnetospira sp. QH-2]|uniref:hemolysin family protein n=1 Tax=Magnetospira sp. (strain QH-2) TaxID=1288970 RepID=UPI0003E81086|nr:hemolysin family protein [Magnetospira sp. QH-2]CCQ73032.1 conserved membrane protein of unknown function [Magnetospira sp. QH-2]
MAWDYLLWLQVTAFILLMGLSAFFSSSETSLFSLDRVKLEQMEREGNPKITLIRHLLNQPRRLIVTILIGNELVNVAASVISASVVIALFGPESKWINLIVMVPILLVVGEITPKTLAIRNNMAFATAQCRPIEFFAKMITPLRWVVRHIADYFITMVVGSERSRANLLTEDMVRSLAREAVGEGALDHQEAKFINQIFDFGDKALREIMTPRSRLFTLDQSLTLAEMAAELTRTGHTKVPVYAHDRETVLGMLFTRDLLEVELDHYPEPLNAENLAPFLRTPYLVPDSRLAADLFHTFRLRKLSVALTVDEYGGVTGMVTMEDLLECIFGEIPSRSEILKEREMGFKQLGTNHYRVDGTMTLHLFDRLTGLQLQDSRVETVGGLLFNAFGELPKVGARMTLGTCEFKILAVSHQRIAEIEAMITPLDPDNIEAFADATSEPDNVEVLADATSEKEA